MIGSARDEATEPAGSHRHGDKGEQPELWWQFPPLRTAAAAGLILGAAFGLSLLGLISDRAAIALYIVAAIVGASHWGREALESIARLKVNIDVLMLVATIGSAVLGLWEEAAFLAFLYASAEAVEELTYDRTRHAIRALLDLAPKEARVLRDGQEVVIAASELRIGDRFLIRPGERLATDGIILEGATNLDEAAVTGESIPVEKSGGDDVFAGTVNLTGAITVEVSRAFEDNTLSRIIHLVEEAQDEKTNTQQFIDRFGARYSPAILISALALLVIPPLLGGDFRTWAERAVTLTVAGAPCALVMSTPVAVAAAIGSAGKRGVLIKGGVHLENLARLRVIAFDKTGTLTKGAPAVTDVAAFGHLDEPTVLGFAAAVEQSSEHPLGQAIVRHAGDARASLPHADAFQALTGAGAKARVEGLEVFVGSLPLFEGMHASLDGADVQAERWYGEGKTVVLVGSRDRVIGGLALRDEARESAVGAIRGLHDEGIARVVMLTGDNERTGTAIAGVLGIEEVRAGLKPDDKRRVIRDLREKYGPTAMVGDGINDAPALAAADVGIAMGTAGTDAAIEAADVALMGEDLASVVYALRLGKRAQRISRQNIVFSIALLAVLVPSAVAGLLTIAVAVTAHEVAEIIAVLNGLRARE